MSRDIYIWPQNGRETPQRRRVAFMTVQTDESSAAAETCPVTGCCHAELMTDCSTLLARGRRRCAGPPVSALLAGRQIQSMPTAVDDVLELYSPARRVLTDAFPYEDRSLENDPSPHRKPVEAE